MPYVQTAPIAIATGGMRMRATRHAHVVHELVTGCHGYTLAATRTDAGGAR